MKRKKKERKEGKKKEGKRKGKGKEKKGRKEKERKEKNEGMNEGEQIKEGKEEKKLALSNSSTTSMWPCVKADTSAESSKTTTPSLMDGARVSDCTVVSRCSWM